MEPPRAHHLRHSFAVGTLLRWYREGINPAERLLHLSTFLGHVDPSSTAVYLTITAELLQEASDRFARFAAPLLKEVHAMPPSTVGSVLYTFFEDYLKCQKGLSTASIRSYRDGLRLFLQFLSPKIPSGPSVGLHLADLSAERVRRFLSTLETERANHIRTRNQRLSALRVFFNYLGTQVPEMLIEAERVAATPMKRVPPPETYFLEREDMTALFASLPTTGWWALRDRTLLLFLYNTGARVQEVADLRVSHLELQPSPACISMAKGNKWRVCPLWQETVALLQQLLPQPPTGTTGIVRCLPRTVGRP